MLFSLGVCSAQGLQGESYRKFEELIDSARVYRSEIDFYPGLKYLDEAESLLDIEYDRYWFGKLESQRANLYFGKGIMDDAGKHFLKGEYYLDSYRDSIQFAINKYNLGNYYMMTYRYNSALQKLLSTVKHLRRQIGRGVLPKNDINIAEQLLASCLQSLGTISLFVHEEEKAIEYYLASLDQFTTIRDRVSVSHTYINIGEAYTRLKKPDLAKAYLDKGHKMSVELDREIDFGLNYQLYGTIEHLYGNWDSALVNYRLSKKYYQKYSKFQDMSLLKVEMSKTYLEMGETDSAVFVLKDALEYLEFNAIYKFRAQAHNALGDAYLSAGELDSAVKSYKMGSSLQDSVIYDAERNMANEMIFFIDKERAEYMDSLTILRQNVQSKEQELEISQKTFSNRLLTFSIVFLVVALIAVLYFLKRNRKVNKLLNQSLDDNRILFQEVHHRVKNNFQIISSLLNLQIGDDTESSGKLNQLRSRVMSMSLVHELLYKTDEANSINFRSYTEGLLSSILEGASVENDAIQSTIRTDDHTFDLDVAIPLGLIMNEAITNSMKYAFPSGYEDARIIISLEKQEEYYLLQIADNGIGIQAQLEKSSESLGHELIEILSEQLEGRFDYLIDKGTTIRVWFKA